ncbi:MAG: SDR family oxidoreductase [Gammaproteobacteria bacterium]|nr:SDR family oxidoreductase [Gammaproteobacteria bacterium]MDH3767572.1 SDR family oxidoreductase [Gammaproteobacteria bacterium]
MSESVVITGANRGIGLKLAQSYIDEGSRVYAGCRKPEMANELAHLAENSSGLLSVHPLDVTNESQRNAFAGMLNDVAIDVLINNAGVYPHKGKSFGQLDAESWLTALDVNTVAPMMMAQTLLPNVAASKRKLVASITSKMGSIADNNSGGSYAYRSTKTALNMAMKSLAIDLYDQGVSVILLHPGWVQTDMGGSQALVTPEQSIKKLRATLDRAGLPESGTFFDLDGSVIPW